MTLTVPSVSFPDCWSAFWTIETREPGLMLARLVPSKLFVPPFSHIIPYIPGRRQDSTAFARSAGGSHKATHEVLWCVRFMIVAYAISRTDDKRPCQLDRYDTDGRIPRGDLEISLAMD